MDRPDEVTRRLLEEVVSGFGGRAEKLAAATSLERSQEDAKRVPQIMLRDFIARSAIGELYRPRQEDLQPFEGVIAKATATILTNPAR